MTSPGVVYRLDLQMLVFSRHEFDSRSQFKAKAAWYRYSVLFTEGRAAFLMLGVQIQTNILAGRSASRTSWPPASRASIFFDNQPCFCSVKPRAKLCRKFKPESSQACATHYYLKAWSVTSSNCEEAVRLIQKMRIFFRSRALGSPTEQRRQKQSGSFGAGGERGWKAFFNIE